MIEILENEVLLSSENTSLLLSKRRGNKLTIEYYGHKLLSVEEIPSLLRLYAFNQGSETSFDEKENASLSENHLKLAVSTMNRGDFFSPSLQLKRTDCLVFDFRVASFEKIEPTLIPGLPTPHDASEELVVHLVEEKLSLALDVHYVVYSKEDVIGCYSEIRNNAETPLVVNKLASLQLPLVNEGFSFVNTYGNWANELNMDRKKVAHGRFVNESLCGSSSNRHNPFVVLESEGCTVSEGNVYGFNFIYSGNHEESAEMDAFDNIRLQVSIASTGFEKVLQKDESFITPMAIMSYSYKGTNGLARNMQDFVTDHIIPINFKDKERPLVYNNWEATGMKFTKGKLVSLMKKAKDLGIELFVLDDGWFSTREDDSHGLGDWEVNEKKLPGGLKELSKKAKDLGLLFGIWMEPEMVNEDTKLYRDHPDWVIQDSIHTPLKGRHQYTLNLTLEPVQNYIFEAVKKTLESGEISYLKWDYNRNISDIPSSTTFYHDYILGLYKVLDRLVKAFPNVLFENCASGGNRFDLGMLSFFPQSWMSDDTDSYQREFIQGGALCGYPLSVMSNHVACKTSSQLVRKTTLDTKFDVAMFGVLGYELDLNDLFNKDCENIKNQIAFYKEHRKTLQFGHLYLVQDYGENRDKMVEALLEDEAIVALYKGPQKPNPKEAHLKALYLDENALYTYKTRQVSLPLNRFGSLVNYVSPIHLKEDGMLISLLGKYMDMKGEVDEGIASGGLLNTSGPVLKQEWSGVGYNENIRMMLDFGSRSYVIRKKN